jgi:flagellar protein FlgJ
MRIEPIHSQIGDPQSQKAAKLADGARQFEAMMLDQMLKPLKFGSISGSSFDGDQNTDEGGDADTIRGFAIEAVGKALAHTGGFGLAKQIIQQVTAEQKAQSKGKDAEL